MSERRLANDGLPYTLAEFNEFYREKGQFFWEQAGASQPSRLPSGESSQPCPVFATSLACLPLLVRRLPLLLVLAAVLQLSRWGTCRLLFLLLVFR